MGGEGGRKKESERENGNRVGKGVRMHAWSVSKHFEECYSNGHRRLDYTYDVFKVPNRNGDKFIASSEITRHRMASYPASAKCGDGCKRSTF